MFYCKIWSLNECDAHTMHVPAGNTHTTKPRKEDKLKKKNHLYKFPINFVYQIPVCIKFVRQFIFQLKKKARAYFFFSFFIFILFIRCIET